MVGSAVALFLVLGTMALPPEQAHVAHAAVHVALDLSVASATVHRSASVVIEASVQPASPQR